MTISIAFAVRSWDTASGTVLTSATFDSTGYTHLVLFGKYEGGAPTTFTPSDNKSSTGWNSLTDRAGTDTGAAQLHWVKIGSPGTGHTVTMTLAAARTFRRIGAWLINADSGAIDLIAGTDITGAAASGTDVNAGSLVTGSVASVSVLGASERNQVSYIPGTGWTQSWDLEEEVGAPQAGFGEHRSDASGTFTANCTQSSGALGWIANAASFREVVIGARLSNFAAQPMLRGPF